MSQPVSPFQRDGKMSSSSGNLEKFRDLLRGAISWLQEMEVDISRTRFSQYEAQLEAVLANPHIGTSADDPAFAHIMEAFESSGELLIIKRNLSQFDSLEFRRRLRAFAVGSYLQRDESPRAGSNRARNLGFELIFAAQLATARFTPLFPCNGDLRTQHPDIRIECKRPQGASKMERALRDARAQLDADSDAADACKIIAISVGKILHGGAAVLHDGDQREVHAALGSKLDDLVAQHEHLWHSPSFENVAGIWFHYSSAALFARTHAMVRASYNRVIVRPKPSRPDWDATVKILSSELNRHLEFGEF